jgi:uncharacterized repeat protein (TIGR01451 family)
VVALGTVAVVAMLATVGAVTATTTGGGTATKGAPTVRSAAAFGVSAPARNLGPDPLVPQGTKPLHGEESEGSLIHPRGDGSFLGQDAALQQGQGGSSLPPTNHNFDGQAIGDNFGLLAGAPPDTNGDVGPNHYVQTVNQVFSVYDKKTGERTLGPIAINQLWKSSPDANQINCTVNNIGDPVVEYDPLADRWLITQFGFAETTLFTGQPTPPFDECIAVSKTGDPTGAYYLYDFQLSFTLFQDYPKLGVWPDGYYLTMNQFDPVLGGFASTNACAFERAQMLVGNASARMVCFNEQDFDPGAASGNWEYGGQLPSDLDGQGVGSNFSALPPAGEPNFFMQIHDSTTAGQDSLLMFKFHVDWADPASSWFGASADQHGQPISIPVADFSSNLCNFGNDRACLPQKESADNLDAIPDRLMNRLAYRNFGDHESLVMNHSVAVGDTPNHAGVRWYELRDPNGTPLVNQQSTYAPDGEHRWMGSAAMDRDGDIALGYSLTSGTRNPAIAYAARLASDPPNTMGRGEQLMFQGPGSQVDTSNRWGDYSSINVDPNGCDFWYTQEYYTGTGSFQWGTRIGSFTIPSCGDPQVSVASSAGLIRLGRDVSYTIGVTSGAEGAKNARVQDILPSGVTLLEVTPSVGTCTGTTTVSCDLGDLPPGTYETIKVDGHASVSGNVKNEVTLTTTNSGDDPVNNSASVVTQVYTPCTPPGAVVARDQTGDTLTISQQDLQSVAVAEPYAGPGVKQLVFTIKVADLLAVPPNTYWYEHFNWGGVHYFVDMNTGDVPAVPSFEYGWVHFDGTFNRYTGLGTVESGSFSADGTITITLSTDKLNLKPDGTTGGTPPTTGSELTAMSGQITALVGAAGSGLLETVDSTGASAYTMAGNSFCAPNTRPSAALTASPTSGSVPLNVTLEGSGSSDADLGDSVASYTFHFGDGSTPVTRSTPTVSHTYSQPGTYRATLTVRDSRGLESTNVAAVNVTASAPTADLGVVKTGPATGRAKRALTYTITVTNNGPDAAQGVTVTDTLPSGVTFNSASSTQGSCSASGGRVTCAAGSLAKGAKVTVTVVFTAPKKGTYTDTASVSSSSPTDPSSSNNTSIVTTQVS